MYSKNLKFLYYSDLEVSLFILIVSTLGSFMQISGASWDITSHLLNQPDSFFTPSHAMLYTGIGLIAISAGVGSYLLKRKKIKQYNSISRSFKLLIIGSFLSLIAGPLDYLWHQSFGLDGLLSPTHMTLATGMLINSVAVFIGLYGVMNNISHWKNLAKFFLIPCLSSLWLTSIWYVFILVLPFSESDFFNFNLDTYSATLKINDAVLVLWGQIFHSLPQARLRLQSKQINSAAAREHLLQRLAQVGIEQERVTIEGQLPREDYLAAYADVDIILDTFPYPGGTTTCEAMWMGVPTVTLAGNTMLARQGASMLTCAGLEEWIANTEKDYVALAIARASDIDRLAQLRSGLRQKVLASPLFDAPRFALNLEDALQGMWQHFHSFNPPSCHV